MRECQHCHTKAQFVIWVVDTGEQNFDPTEGGLLEAEQYWCLDCVRGIKEDKKEIRKMIWDEYIDIETKRVELAAKKYKELTGKDNYFD